MANIEDQQEIFDDELGDISIKRKSGKTGSRRGGASSDEPLSLKSILGEEEEERVCRAH